jgi:hypothetical protein
MTISPVVKNVNKRGIKCVKHSRLYNNSKKRNIQSNEMVTVDYIDGSSLQIEFNGTFQDGQLNKDTINITEVRRKLPNKLTYNPIKTRIMMEVFRSTIKNHYG